MKRIAIALMTAAAAVILTACHESVPRPEHDAPDAPGAETPADPSGPSDPVEWFDFTAEAVDDVPRFVSHRLTLRYDTPGVLVRSNPGGPTASFHDLDGNARAEMSWQSVDAGGVISGFSLRVNGCEVPTASARVMKTAPSRLWVLAVTAGDEPSPVVIVIPR